MRVLILGTKGDSEINAIYNHIRNYAEVVGVILECRQPVFTLLKRRSRRIGKCKIIAQILFRIMISPILRVMSRRRIAQLQRIYNFDVSPIPVQLISSCRSHNESSCTPLYTSLAPDFVLIKGTRILAKKTLDSFECPAINIHAGITPWYRGVHGAYWALVNRDPDRCGVTLHIVDEGIDSGAIVSQARLTFGPRDNYVTYPIHQLAKGMDLLTDILCGDTKALISGAISSGSLGRNWSHPGIFEYFLNGVRRHVW